MTLVNLPPETGVIRKVQWATVGASIAGTIGMQVAAVLADPLAYGVVSLLPFWDTEGGFLAVATLIELALVGIFSAGGAFGGGYYARSRPTDLVAKEPVQ